MTEPQKKSHRGRNLLIIGAVLVVVAALAMMLFYDIIYFDFVSFMEDQPSIGYQDPPRRLPGAGALSISWPAYHDEPLSVQNPVPPDEVSLQRGKLLFDVHCTLCHGYTGRGDGPVTSRWQADARKPADLSAERFAQYPDSLFYTTITQGIGRMPALRENLTERQVWDVVNYARSLQP